MLSAPFRNDEEWIASSLALLAITAVRINFKQPAAYRHGFAISPRLSREVWLRNVVVL